MWLSHDDDWFHGAVCHQFDITNYSCVLSTLRSSAQTSRHRQACTCAVLETQFILPIVSSTVTKETQHILAFGQSMQQVWLTQPALYILFCHFVDVRTVLLGDLEKLKHLASYVNSSSTIIFTSAVFLSSSVFLIHVVLSLFSPSIAPLFCFVALLYFLTERKNVPLDMSIAIYIWRECCWWKPFPRQGVRSCCGWK